MATPVGCWMPLVRYADRHLPLSGYPLAAGQPLGADRRLVVLAHRLRLGLICMRGGDSVTGKRLVMSGQTGSWVMNEYPRQGAGQCSTPLP